MALTWYVEWEPKNMKAYRSSHGGDSACDTFVVVGHDCELCAVMEMSRGNAWVCLHAVFCLKQLYRDRQIYHCHY